jgi:hypothetical protein
VEKIWVLFEEIEKGGCILQYNLQNTLHKDVGYFYKDNPD